LPQDGTPIGSFNPRARMGRDLALAGLFAPTIFVSIHAPAWGATKCLVFLVSYKFRFNPRARMGRDKDFLQMLYTDMLFQSTRPHGARLFYSLTT